MSSNYDLENIKKPPSSINAECSVIGALLINNESWYKIENMLLVDDFFSKQHQIIFSQMQKLFQQNIPFDIVTLSDSLANEKLLEKAGGLHYLADVVQNTPTSSNISIYARIIKDRSKFRLLLNYANSIADMVYSPEGRSINDVLDIAEQKILAIGKSSAQKDGNPQSIQDVIPKVINRIDAIMGAKNGITGISYGFTDLDDLTSGMHPANLIIIAGRPSMGKTAFAINIAESVAKNSKKPVLIFSLEMPCEDIIMRMISSLGCIEQNALRNGRLEDEHWAKITDIIEMLSKRFNMYIDDRSALTPTEIRSKARKVYRENNGLSMVIVDYLQLIKAPGYENNRAQEVAEISRSLKSLSKELSVPVLALSQLNRSVDDRTNKRPMMSDLRDSGAIEQDADVILFIYRDEVYYKNKEGNKGLAEIIIGKQRNGPIGNIKVQFEGRFCRFANLSFEQDLPDRVY